MALIGTQSRNNVSRSEIDSLRKTIDELIVDSLDTTLAIDAILETLLEDSL